MLTIKGELASAHVEAEELINHIGQTVQIHGIVYKIQKSPGAVYPFR